MTNQAALAESLAHIDRAFGVRAAPVRPVHSKLGVTASPQGAVDYLNARLAEQGIIGERVEYAVERIDGTIIPAGHGYRYGGKAPAVKIAAE